MYVLVIFSFPSLIMLWCRQHLCGYVEKFAIASAL
jgi:hypothetical protein